LHLTIHIDGGSRGNPGPAAAGIVLSADDGTVLHEAGIYLGKATNNVAEYSGLIAALKAATKLGAKQVDVFSDSELIVRQMNGQYRVKDAGLRPLFEQASALSGGFKRCNLQHVPRERNTQADELVNRALNLKRNVGDAEE
jgi:ribonuclease HI